MRFYSKLLGIVLLLGLVALAAGCNQLMARDQLNKGVQSYKSGQFQAAIEQHQPDLVGMSALLTTTMGQMKVNIEAFDKAGLFSRLRVMVGGAPVSPDYARAAGAHGYGKDASTAVQLALKLLTELKHQQPRAPLINADFLGMSS